MPWMKCCRGDTTTEDIDNAADDQASLEVAIYGQQLVRGMSVRNSPDAQHCMPCMNRVH